MTVASGQHGHLDVGGFSLGPLWLRVLLLGAVLSTAAFAMLRGFLGEPNRRTTTAVLTATFGAAALELLLSGGLAVPEQTVPLLLAALAVPLYLALSQDPARATMVARARRYALWLFWPAAFLAAVRFGQAWLNGWEPVLLHTGVVFGLVAVAWFTVAKPRKRGVMTSRVGAGLLAVGLVGAVGQAVVTRPAEPTPGLASTTTVTVGTRQANVIVVPNLPGWNLVHVDTSLEIGADPSNLASPTNGWLPVQLPPGRAELWLSDGRDTGSFATNTGTGATALRDLAGPNGQQCANALLGRMLVKGALTGAIECPSAASPPANLTTSDSFQRYEAAHRAAYPSLAPSMAGFQSWLSARESAQSLT
ncbi:DUF6239 family natural product biosynthesis protein [Actinophytocola sp.]|uniref:DUF6239 family natural product biosynthesis protein n=1 Tax=Actinophytocola sp. TaxID=1872138 RepID=UPI002ED0CBD7